MKRRRIILSIVLALSLALVSISSALALQPLPSSFYGTVKIDGLNVPVGSQVKAFCGTTSFALSEYMTYLGDTVYSLNVPGDDPATPGTVEGCSTTATVSFTIDGLPAIQTAPWLAGTNVELNLTASTPTAVPFTISGNVGVAGAVLTFTGTMSGSTIADDFGNYSFNVTNNWAGVVSPSFTGYTFYPSNRTYVNVVYHQTLQNFEPVVGAPPALPSSFYGTVKSNGANVPSGIRVTARINGKIFATSAFIVYQGDTVYTVDVPGDDPDTTNVVEGGVEGDIVEFYVGSTKATQTGTWHSGKNVELNLTVTLPKFFQITLPLTFR